MESLEQHIDNRMSVSSIILMLLTWRRLATPFTDITEEISRCCKARSVVCVFTALYKSFITSMVIDNLITIAVVPVVQVDWCG